MKATGTDGTLQPTNCYIQVLTQRVCLNILPEISDSKSSAYNDEPIIGRSFPVKTYSHGENRTISVNAYFYADTQEALIDNNKSCRILQSAVYPRDDDNATSLPFMPPPLCQFYCSGLISSQPLCVVLRKYGLKIPRDVPWDENTMTPYYFTMDLEFDVVYNNSNLPGQEKVLGDIPATMSRNACVSNLNNSSSQNTSSSSTGSQNTSF